MRGWVGWHSTVSWKEAAIGRAKKVQWQWQQHLWNIRLKWNQRTTKEGAGNKGKPQNKDHFMWGWSKAQSMWHEELRRRNLSKLFYGHTRLSVAQPNALNPQCWNKSKRQESNNSYTTKTWAGTILRVRRNRWSQQATRLQDCRWDYIYTVHRKNKLHTWLVPEETDNSLWRAQTEQATVHSKKKKAKTKRQKIKRKESVKELCCWQRTQRRRQDNSNNWTNKTNMKDGGTCKEGVETAAASECGQGDNNDNRKGNDGTC